MKYLATFLTSTFLLTLFIFPGNAANAWTQKESGTLNAFRDVLRSDDTFVAVGNGVAYSTDGSTWTKSTGLSSNWLYSVASKSDGTLYAVGANAVVLTSANRGTSWSQLNLNISSHLNAVAFGGEAGYMAGSDGTLLYYTNQINNWIQASSPVTNHLYAISVLSDGRTAFAVGNNGVFLTTTQGGVNWTKITNITTEELKGVYFKDAQTGWVVGTNGTFFKTTTGGASWSAVHVGGLSTQHLSAIDTNGDVMVVAGKNIALRSEDGGVTWVSYLFDDVTLTLNGAFVEPHGNTWVVGTKDDVWSKVYQYEAAVVAEPETTPEPITPVETAPTDFGEASSGDLIKTICAVSADVNDPCKAVYFLSEDGKRHAFPNERVFYTWYGGFSGVVEVSPTFMSSRTLGKNVTYHPGKKMVKFQSVPTVYVVEKGGVLRAVVSEEVATSLYGATWNQQIDDIPDAFYGNYTFGQKVESASDYDRVLAQASVDDLNDQYVQ